MAEIIQSEVKARLYRVGAIASILQLVIIALYMVVVMVFGQRVESSEEFFLYQQDHFWSSLLRVDLMMLILIGLYLGNYPGLVLNLWKQAPITTLFASIFLLIAITLSFAGESTFALLHLAEQYQAASSELERAGAMAAGDAILAGGWWHSTGSYMTGFLLQGSGVMISIVMLKSDHFSKVTAYAGMIGNGFDLLQHLLSPFAPHFSEYLSFVMVAYLVWYPMMARDLIKLSKKQISA